ncbi:MAG: sulfide/dihydroorotate dehydrogenase-like FAD/NAD-binding protein, partial [Fibrobacterota bacterium]
MLASNIVKLVVAAPEIAKKRKAGQFIMLKIDEEGERIPLTIADADPVLGSVTLIAQVVGKTTLQLAALSEGDSVMDFAGPLGKPTHIEKAGHVVCVGGGIGVAPMHPMAQAF